MSQITACASAIPSAPFSLPRAAAQLQAEAAALWPDAPRGFSARRLALQRAQQSAAAASAAHPAWSALARALSELPLGALLSGQQPQLQASLSWKKLEQALARVSGLSAEHAQRRSELSCWLALACWHGLPELHLQMPQGAVRPRDGIWHRSAARHRQQLTG